MERGSGIEFAKMQHATNLADREYNRKFKMFFTGLIFAIISFIGSHPISTTHTYLKIIEIVALSSLLLSGLLLLGKLSSVQVKDSLPYKELPCKYKFVYFIFNLNIHYWFLFIFGMILLLIDRSVNLLSS